MRLANPADGAQIIEFDHVVLEYSFYGKGFLSMLDVHPARRREGIGERLLRHMETLCQTDKLFTSTNFKRLTNS